MTKFILNARRRGFTLIELLVVVLILAILMAIALPLYLNAVANSELRTCRSNMQTIGNAVHANRVATRGTYPAAGTAVEVTLDERVLDRRERTIEVRGQVIADVLLHHSLNVRSRLRVPVTRTSLASRGPRARCARRGDLGGYATSPCRPRRP